MVFDSAPSGKQFGDVLVEPNNVYRRGERVSVEFVTGHPKNDLRRGGTFLEVQRQVNGAWVRHADDGDWSTRYHWQRIEMGDSKAVITWEVPANAPIGQYRVVHHGNWKHGVTGAITAFTGTTRTFLVS